MQTLTIRRYDQLSYSQWRRVVATAKRQVRKFTSEPCEIGVGRKFRREKPTGNRITLRVYLRSKRRRVAASKQVPNPFVIRLRRQDGCYDLLQIQSDVEKLSSFVPTSGKVISSGNEARSGYLIRWMNSEGIRCWGFLTVAHLFNGSRSVAAQVRVSRRVRFQCHRLPLPSRRAECDAAILKIVGPANNIAERLVISGLIDQPDAAARHPMTIDEVRWAAASHHTGRAIGPDENISFVGEEVFPNGFRLGDRRLSDCIRVSGGPGGSFRKGTSGSQWDFQDTPACMQVGGKSPHFSEGLGQPIAKYLDWLRDVLCPSIELVATLDAVSST